MALGIHKFFLEDAQFDILRALLKRNDVGVKNFSRGGIGVPPLFRALTEVVMDVRIVRVTEYRGATMGVLCINDKPEMLTLEEAWRDNRKNESCIPTGNYQLVRHRSPRFGMTFQVANVPDRSAILIHPGNTIKDTDGCLLVGFTIGQLEQEPAILQSTKAFDRFMQKLKGIDVARLSIVSALPTGLH